MRNIHVLFLAILRSGFLRWILGVRALIVFSLLFSVSSAFAAPKISMMPSYAQNPVHANTGLNEAITVWGRAWNGTAPYAYTLDYGDGTTALTGSTSNPSFIGAAHTYTSAGLKTVTLTVTDNTGATATKTAMIRVLISPTHQERVHMAIQKGLLSLYQNVSTVDANRVYWPNPSGTSSSTTYSLGSTSAAILAFEENDHLPDEDDEDDVYAEVVRKGLNQLFSLATSYNIGAAQHSDGIAVRDTDSNDNGRGIYFNATSGHGGYSTPFAGMAIILSKRNAAEAQATMVPYGSFTTSTYYEFIRDVLDQMMWCQGDGTYRGGWEYEVTTQNQPRYDGSVQQWPTLLMLAARDRWGIETPQWMKDNIVYGFKYLQSSNGGIGYSSSGSWRNLAKTGGSLAAFALNGKLASDSDADATMSLNFIQNYWLSNPSWDADLAGWTGQWYAMWGLKKGLQFQNITLLNTSTGLRDWKQDMQAWLLGNGTLLDSQGGNVSPSYRNTDNMFGQRADGSWRSSLSPGAGASSSVTSQLSMDTAHGVLILSDAVTTPVPVASIATVGTQTNKAAYRAFTMDASGSYHLDLNSSIVEYLWDWDDSDGVDWDHPDASGPRPTNPGYTAVGTYTVTLRVKDNNDPAQTDQTTLQVQVIDTDIAPVAVAKPPGTYPGYAGQVAETITLDGTGSYDPDGDPITDYAWDTDGDGQYDDATGPNPTVTFNAPYTGYIGLQVTANGRTSTNSAYVEVNVSADDLRLGTITASNVVYGNTADLSIPIYNDSAGSFTSTVQVKLYNANPFLSGVQLGTTYTVSVDAGSSTVLNVSNLALKGAEYVWVFLDSNRVISEYNEENSLGSVWVGMRPEIAVSGNGTEITDGDTTPALADHTDFGNVVVSSGTVVRTFTITNSGTADLNLTGTAPNYVTLSGSSAFTITQQPTSGTVAMEGGTQTFQITFDPSALGTQTATISIANNDMNETPYDFTIQGKGVEPEIAVSGNSVDISSGDSTPSATDHTSFGSVSALSGTIVRTFTVTNSGDAVLSLTGTPLVALSGPGASAFSVTTQPASSSVAVSGGTQTFQITFDPAVAGDYAATVTIASNDADEGTFTFAIDGTGLAPEIALTGNGNPITDGDSSVSSSNYTSFGSTTVAGGTVVRTFTITNDGDVTLQLTGTPLVALSGSGAAAFRVSAQPSPATVATGGGTRTFEITFDPSSPGLHEATVTIANNDIDEGSFDFAISGTGDAVPGVTLTGANPLSVNLGSTYTDPGATALDPEDGPLTPTITSNTVVPNRPGIYEVTWSATDTAGVTITATRTVIVMPGAQDKTPPGLAITSPTSSTVSSTVNFGGTVKDQFGIQSVVVTLNGVEVPLDTPLNFVANTNLPWSISNLVMENGPNVFQITTTDLNGRKTTVTKTVYYWSRRPALAGSFCALVEPASTPSHETFGLVQVTVTDTGSFSGNVKIAGVTLPFTGVIQNDGRARFMPSRLNTFPMSFRTYIYEQQKKGRILVQTLSRDLGELSFTVDGSTGMEGTVTQTGTSTVIANFAGAVAPYRKGNLVPAPFLNLPITGTKTKGVYNIAFPSKAQSPPISPSLYPQGDGYAVLTLSNLGTASISGYLADGTLYTGSSMLRSDDTMVLYTPLYSNLGAMGGELTFADDPDTDVKGSNLIWLRPAITTAVQYSAGWPTGVMTDAAGTKYAAPASLNFGQGAVNTVLGNANLDFEDGQLVAPLRYPVSVNPTTGAIIKVPANNPSFTGTITTASGLLYGTFRHSNGINLSYKALLLNKGANQGGYGWFLRNGPNGQGGGVTLDPAGP